ncbi:hypothetical protein HDU76_003091 [Blyttiomyces sp. JEL0837]|nr:hypothetical protein HDU76_003091 [Blyttiomyces sp. JEL0837]
MSLYSFDDDDDLSKVAATPSGAPSKSSNAATTAAKPIIPAGWTAPSRLMAPVKRKAAAPVPRPQKPVKASLPTQSFPNSEQPRPIASSTSSASAFIPLPHELDRQADRRPMRGKKIDPMKEDYDPSKPNEYEYCKAEFKRRKREGDQIPEEEVTFNAPPTHYPPSRPHSPTGSDEDSIDGEPMNAATFTSARPQSPPPPSALAQTMLADQSGEDAYLRRVRLSQQQPVQSVVEPVEPPRKSQSRVLMLRNMVGPGEVDDDLEDETASECSKYGPVERCLIFEVPKGQVPPEEAVRIFVKFKSAQSAAMAQSKMNGRFFGGRSISALPFPEERFDKLDLAPKPLEEYQQ